VLGLIVAGLTNKEIGRALDVSPRTVETHRANLFAKLRGGVAGAADPPLRRPGRRICE
jgi:FixJ family two-component response regulator